MDDEENQQYPPEFHPGELDSSESSDYEENEFEDEDEEISQAPAAPWSWKVMKRKENQFVDNFKFNVEEFKSLLWPRVSDIFVKPPKCGRKWKLCAKSRLLLILAYLRKGFCYGMLGPLFHLSSSRARLLIKEDLPKLRDRLKGLIKWNNWNQQAQHLSEDDGNTFSRCVCIIDATEHPCNRPSTDQRNFYSGKSKMHVIKSQIAVEPVSGRIMHVVCGVRGIIHDKVIFDLSGIIDLVGVRESVMADSGYQGIQHSVRALMPFKKPRKGALTNEQKIWNRQLGRKRVLVEHVFGALKKWTILDHRWKGRITELPFYQEVFLLCCCLYNLLKFGN